MRRLKGLEDVVGMSVASPVRNDDVGWEFAPDRMAGCTDDPINGFKYLYELYLKTKPDYSGYITTPVLWDCKTSRIVTNESEDIVRLFNHAFDDLPETVESRAKATLTAGTHHLDFCPADKQAERDSWNELIYKNVNNGVYRAGLAKSQEAYESAVRDLFGVLDKVEKALGEQRYLIGDALSEVDVRLFVTLSRFDAVYYGLFKCNLRRIQDYPNLG